MRLSHTPSLRTLRVFCIAARQCSFKVAADELFLTPSAVSHQIKELEDTLGVVLFERKTRALDLTTAGHALLEDVEPLLEALDRSLTQIARRGTRRRLRILIPPFFASELFVPRLGSFCAAHPDIDIQVETREPRPAAHPPTADVSILLSDDQPQGLQVERLFEVRLVAACAPQHAATIAKLGRHAFREIALIVHRPRPFAWVNWAEEIGLDPPEPKSILELNTMSSIVSAAEAGLGVALVPEALCGRRFHSGTLVRVFPVEVPIRETYYIACRGKDASKREVAAAMEWTLEEFRSFDEPSLRHTSSIGKSRLRRFCGH
jgi:LysR family glycine cleavage system transcriptional activator